MQAEEADALSAATARNWGLDIDMAAAPALPGPSGVLEAADTQADTRNTTQLGSNGPVRALSGENEWQAAAAAAAGEPGDESALDEPEDESNRGGGGGKKARSSGGGRFSGRLACKGDEKRLVEECKRLGPLLRLAGAGPAAAGGSKQDFTLPKIVRAMASGESRR